MMDLIQTANEVFVLRNIIYFAIGFFGCLLLLKILNYFSKKDDKMNKQGGFFSAIIWLAIGIAIGIYICKHFLG